MKAWHVTQLGEPENALELLEVAKPEIKHGEILIKVEAAALNYFDILLCQGLYQEKPELPFIPGAEISGTVEKVGDNSEFKVGERVLAKAKLPHGGYSEWQAVKEEDVFLIPKQMNFVEAASYFMTYQTAYFALKRTANLKAGETLLVHGGSGGVGSAAIQLGKAMGAYVIATAGSEEKTAVCLKLGADKVINYREKEFKTEVNNLTNQAGADVIFDPVGGDVFDQSRRCINFEGRLLVIGFAGGRIADAPTNHALVKNYYIMGVHFGYFQKKYPKAVKEAHEELMVLYEKGKIKPLVYKEYPFNQLPLALRTLADRKSYGKLIIK